MLVSGKPSLLPEGASYARIEASIHAVSADPAHVDQFATVCNFEKNKDTKNGGPKNGDTLPLPYPHILAAPLHYAILNHQDFPLKLLGLVHIANSITQHRPIGVLEIMDIHCFIEGFDDTAKGQVFHLHTQVSIEGERVWEEVCSFLARKKSNNKKKSDPPKNKESDAIASETTTGASISSWEVPANMGRRFAKVSGDVNPIHMSNITAKIFGFKQAIIHGVWSMSRTMAELEARLLATEHGLANIKMDVNFKLPVFIPAWVSLQSNAVPAGLDFVLKDSAGEKPHMSGSFRYL